MSKAIFLAGILLLPWLAHAETTSPYSGQQMRAIKALSQADIDGLLEGRGMELAKPAELNSYPGPAHVLELADDLGLTKQQIAALRTIQGRMASEAKGLGAAIVEKEGALDRLFADRTIRLEEVRKSTLDIGELRGRLRAVHLQAHLETTAELTPQQIHRYDVLRGYTDSSATGAPSHQRKH